jgi:UDP-N-acetylmuramate-alanine ligase
MLKALARADRVVIGAVKQRSSASVEIMDTEALAEGLRGRGVEAVASRSNDAALESLRSFCGNANESQVVAFLTNGSFGGIIERFVD